MHPSLSGLVSAGANLVPEAWQRMTESSLRIKDDGDVYPDQVQQIWELGAYLQELKGLYEGSSVPLMKQILSDMGIIDSPASTFEIQEDIGEKIDQLKELMKEYGDYP
jgi:dihydrodipicolinate synthase/N-acetylneuraminate lyase